MTSREGNSSSNGGWFRIIFGVFLLKLHRRQFSVSREVLLQSSYLINRKLSNGGIILNVVGRLSSLNLFTVKGVPESAGCQKAGFKGSRACTFALAVDFCKTADPAEFAFSVFMLSLPNDLEVSALAQLGGVSSLSPSVLGSVNVTSLEPTACKKTQMIQMKAN
ncbi:RNA-dependent RNA polymerase 2 [Striga asiatica]|uniref:RNA-dependent RNA polymerase 2 n=1 Tax=Striga asiatica TaxID=4170 RepID=A0A5A7QU39_STRAF|nr:RNA-dependent RNA polymerase 2 [Striga asiatica]